jgi:hypothetical protein
LEQFEHAHGVVAKIDQHSDRLLLVRAAVSRK